MNAVTRICYTDYEGNEVVLCKGFHRNDEVWTPPHEVTEAISHMVTYRRTELIDPVPDEDFRHQPLRAAQGIVVALVLGIPGWLLWWLLYEGIVALLELLF